ncbi:MAG TPA: hypothetical protein VKZ76_01505 [Edaphocola sp.]|nr:hypothetical protein [Edaphocola sp.]
MATIKNPVLSTLYQCDQQLFISYFCKNKAKPEMQCNGKCFWSENGGSESNEAALTLLKLLQAETVWCPLQSICVHAISLFVSEPLAHQSYYSDNYRFSFIQQCFHPPVC